MQKNINSSLHISYGERLIWLNFPVHKNPGIWCPMCLEHDCLGKKAWLGTQEVLPTTCLCLKLQRASQSLADMQNVWERAALARADKEDWLDTRQSDWVSYGTRLPKEQNPLLTALASDTPAAVRWSRHRMVSLHSVEFYSTINGMSAGAISILLYPLHLGKCMAYSSLFIKRGETCVWSACVHMLSIMNGWQERHFHSHHHYVISIFFRIWPKDTVFKLLNMSH